MAIPSFCTLKSRTVLEITGPEAHDFLQGLVTNNMDKVSTENAIYAALLTPQGKILFDFFISQPTSGTYWLECSAQQSADLAKRLTFYKLRADVTITPLSDSHKVVTLWGEGSTVHLKNQTAGSAGKVFGGYGYIDPRSVQAGIRVILSKDIEISDNTSLADEPTYTAHRISLGLADTDVDIGSSQRFVHECNLDLTNGVDFSKGCYVGQEVVSRMHHKQTTRKRIMAISTEHVLAPDTKISAGEKAIGDVLSSAGTQALAVIRLDRALSANEVLTADGAPIHLTKTSWVNFDLPGETNDK